MATPADERPALRGGLSAAAFFSIAFGSMIGVGWVTALGDWLGKAGPGGAMAAFAAGGGLMVLIGLCYAELTSMFPVAGGEVAYSYAAHGTGRSFVVGWFLAFGYLSVSAFEAVSVGRVVAYLAPGIDRFPLYEIGGETVYATHLALAGAFTAGLTWINLRGAGDVGRVQTILMTAFLTAALVLIGAGLFFGDATAVTGWFGEFEGGPLAGGLAVFVTAPFWFVGFDAIPQAAEEASSSVSPRRLGALIVASILAAALFYVVLILAVAMLGDWRETASAPLATAEAFRRAFGSEAAADLVLVAALLGLLTSWNGFFLAGSRVLFALGRGAVISTKFGATHPRFGSPATAVAFSGLSTFAGAALGRGAMISFVNVGSLAIALAFCGVCASAWTLRKTHPRASRPYRAAGGRALPAAAFFGALFVLSTLVAPRSPANLRWPLEWAIFGAICAAGGAAWLFGGPARRAVPESERTALILGPAAAALESDSHAVTR